MHSILLTQHHQHIFNAYDKFPFTSLVFDSMKMYKNFAD